MELKAFTDVLNSHPDQELVFRFPSGETLAPHFHVTEIGKVTKDFVDCGGTRRMTESCMLQTLVANDVDHRLTAGKLAGVLKHAEVLGLADSAPVEAEVQMGTIGIFAVDNAESVDGGLRFDLLEKRTACLAPEKCRLELPVLGQSCCDDDTDCC